MMMKTMATETQKNANGIFSIWAVLHAVSSETTEMTAAAPMARRSRTRRIANGAKCPSARSSKLKMGRRSMVTMPQIQVTSAWRLSEEMSAQQMPITFQTATRISDAKKGRAHRIVVGWMRCSFLNW